MLVSVRLTLLLLTTASLMDASPKTLLKGAVVDTEGAVIRGAYVFVHWDRSGSHVGLKSNVGLKSDLVLETDANGKFASELPPGFYDVFTSAAAFSPDCRKIRIKLEETVIYEAKLNADPLVIKEIGDSAFH